MAAIGTSQQQQAVPEPLGPEDLQGVFDCLKWALSPQTEQRTQAEAALRALELRPGFCSCLAVGALAAIMAFNLLAAGASLLNISAIAPQNYVSTYPQEILSSKDADHSVRWLAAVHFKNSCNKYWRARLPG